MSAPLIILASLPSFCQKSSKLVEIWQSSDKYKFAQFFLRHGVHYRVLRHKVCILGFYEGMCLCEFFFQTSMDK